MIILSVDTATEYGSVAVRINGKPVAEVALHSREGFAHILFTAIDQCLAEAEIQLEDIDCFAAAAGPGSFTGVRVALTTIKGMAEATGRRALGISNLRALSVFAHSPNLPRAVLLEARRSEVYGAVYDAGLHLVMSETVGPLTHFIKQLGDPAGYEFIAPKELALPMRHTEAPSQLAGAIAVCAEQDSKDGRWPDPAELDANYVRRSDAELSWKDKS